MSSSIKTAVILFSLIFTTSCVTMALATPYQKLGFGDAYGGYRDKQISKTDYLIEVYGNGYSTEEELKSFFHRRANELAKGRKYKSNFKFSHSALEVKSSIPGIVDKQKYPMISGTIKIDK